MVRHLLAWLIDTILPRHRDAERGRLLDVTTLGEKLSPHTLTSSPWIHTLFSYQDTDVRAAVKALKYYGETEVAKTLGTLIADYATELLAEKKALHGWRTIVVCPIPSSSKRLRERGYNQAGLIAKVASEIMGVRYEPSLLSRTDRTSQVHVDRSKRKENMKGAFTALPAHNLSIILIDDVVESGATLTDARRALIESGAVHVIAITVAH